MCVGGGGGGSIANERGIFVFVFYNNFYEVKEQVQIQLFFPAQKRGWKGGGGGGEERE